MDKSMSIAIKTYRIGNRQHQQAEDREKEKTTKLGDNSFEDGLDNQFHSLDKICIFYTIPFFFAHNIKRDFMI